MSSKLFDRNEDLRRLRDEGYNVEIFGAHLVVRDIPYVNEQREVFYNGILITGLNLNGDIANRPEPHTIRFAGQRPCTSEGAPIEALRLEPEVVRYSDVLSSQFHFSSKPERGHYLSYYEQIKTYSSILSGHAAILDVNATPKTFRVVEPAEGESPFNYLDTASARAEITMVTNKLAVQRLGIVGLGGTGSYVLDFLAKTPVREIHLFDGDKFSSHNAFRAPGAASIDDLHRQLLKVDYLKEIYSKMHRGIIAHGEYVDGGNVEQLRQMDCVFLCVDAGPVKKLVVEKLEEFGVRFIDTGMGLYVADETIGGVLRVTTSDNGSRPMARARMSFGSEDGENEYDKNIQIADLNALNAILAIIRWKKTCGFYFDFKCEHFNSYTIGTGRLLNEDINEQD